MIPDCGPVNARIMLIGDCGNQHDLKTDEPFSSPAGNLLKNMLASADIKFKDCYTTYVVNEACSMDSYYKDAKRKNPTDELLIAWQTLLKKIDQIKPNVVICIGKEALRAVTGRLSITTWRGSVMLVNNRKVIATYHPESILRLYDNRPICEMDLAKAARESAREEYIVNEPEITVMPNYGRVLEWFDDLYKDNPERVSFDIETTYGTLVIRTIGLAYKTAGNKIKSISVPFTTCSQKEDTLRQRKGIIHCTHYQNIGYSSYFETTQEVQVISLFDRLFSNPKIRKISQNGISFDQQVLEEQFGLTFKNHYMDTIHAHHVCYLEFPKALNFLTTMYTDYQNYWSDKRTDDDKSNSVYNCWDCVVTLEASYAIEKELKDLEMHDLYFNFVHRLAFPLARMSNYGLQIDVTERERLKTIYQKEVDEINTWVETKYNRPINLNSPKQIKELLYDQEKFPRQKGKTGNDSTDDESLKNLIKRYPREEILSKILRYREIAKLISTYLSIPLDPGNIFRTSFNPSGTTTGRTASSKTIRGTGSNMQNIPPSIRPLFTAREGYTFIEGDLSQAETLVVAELLARNHDRTLIEKYQDDNFDIHRWAAAGIYGCKEEDVTKEQRQIGKLRNHSGNYGAGPGVLVSQSIKRGITYNGATGIDFRDSKRILEAGHKMLPGLKRWWTSVEQQLRKTRCLTTIFGRKRFFFGRLDQTAYRTAYAFEPQSTIGDLTNKIIVELDARLPDNCFPAMQVHDSVMIECLDSEVANVIKLFRECAKIPLDYKNNKEPLIIPLDIKYGKKWGELKEITDDSQVS